MTERGKGIMFMVLGSFFFALMAMFVKLAGDLPTAEKLFFRSVVGTVGSGFLIYRSGGSFLGKDRKMLFVRAVLGFLGLAFYFYAIDNLPLANAVILNQMSPFFTLILAFLLLSETIFRQQWGAISLALVGVTLIVKPGLDYSAFPALVGLLSAVFSAGAYTAIRHLRLTDHPQTIVFYFTALTCLITLPVMAAGQFVMPTGGQWAALLGVGVTATMAQFLMTHAYRYCEAGDLSIYSYGNTLFAMLIGALLWGQFPDGFSFAGIVFVLAGAYLNWRVKREAHLFEIVRCK